MEKMIIKYHNCNFSSKTNFKDTENNYFKYTEIDHATLDYSFVHDLKRKDINQFLNDIHNIKRVYHLLEVEIQHYKSHYKLYKKKFDKDLLSVATMKNPNYKKQEFWGKGQRGIHPLIPLCPLPQNKEQIYLIR